MKKIIKSTATLMLVLCMLVAAIPASASDLQTDESEIVTPRYVACSYVDTCLTIGSLGYSVSSVEVYMYSGYTAEITMTLQKSSNGILWSDDASWTSSGSSNLALSKARYVLSGYYYRVVSEIEIYNSTGTKVESITDYSNMIFYN